MSNKITAVDAIKKSITQMEPEFAKALPPHINPKKFIRVVQTAITTSPNLMEADRMSLLAACTKAAEIGLLPNGIEAALVPFKGKVQFMSMISGKLKLARNSGEIQSIDAQIVYNNDYFDYYIDEEGAHLKHKPNLFEDRGDVIAAYAMGKTKDGGVYIEVMTNDQIAAVEKSSRGNNTPWKGPFRSEMIKKSVLNRLLKRMPTSTDIDMDTENDYQNIDIPIVQAESKKSEPEPEREKDVTAPKKLAELVESKEKNEEQVPI